MASRRAAVDQWWRNTSVGVSSSVIHGYYSGIIAMGGSVAEWLACWSAVGPEYKSQLQRCRVTVLGKLFAPIIPLFTRQ